MRRCPILAEGRRQNRVGTGGQIEGPSHGLIRTDFLVSGVLGTRLCEGGVNQRLACSF